MAPAPFQQLSQLRWLVSLIGPAHPAGVAEARRPVQLPCLILSVWVQQQDRADAEEVAMVMMTVEDAAVPAATTDVGCRNSNSAAARP